MNTTYPCPACRAPADLDAGCSGCHRPPDPEAAEVIALDARYAVRAREVGAAWQAYLSGAADLEELRQRRNRLAARVAARAFATRTPVAPLAPAAPARPYAPAPPPVSGPPPGAGGPPVPARPETSTRTVQNVLFVLGGLLLGSAAIVFTAVAWASFGVAGRAAILAVTTLLVLAVPPVALARRLSATAETFAALGLLLVLLDGYAAWYVDLAGLATVLTPREYAGGVCAMTATLALGYGLATRLVVGRHLGRTSKAALIGPRFAALVLAQPVLPLLAGHHGLGVTGWAAVFGVVALGDAAAGWRRGRYEVGVVALVLGGFAWGVAGLLALIGDAGAGTVPAALRAGLVLVLVAAVPIVPARAPLAGAARPVLTRVAAGLVAAALVAAAGRVALAGWPAWTLPLTAAALAALALAGRALPAPVRSGPRIALGAWAGLLTLVAIEWALVDGTRAVGASLPAWRATLAPTTTGTHLQLVLALVLLAVAGSALLPAGWAVEVAAATVVPVVLAVPAALPLAWWVPSTVDCVAMAALALLAVARRRPHAAAWAAGFIAVDAVLVSLGRPAGTAAVAGALVGIAALVAVAARTRRPVLGAVATGTGLVGLPLLGAALAGTLGADPAGTRAGAALGLVLAAVAVPVLRRAWPGYAPAGMLAVPLAGTGVVLAALVAGGERVGPYAALAALCGTAAVAVVRRPSAGVAVAGTLSGLAALPAVVTALPAVWSVAVAPYAWLGAIWSGVPAGSGLTPAGGVAPVHGTYGLAAASVTLALLAAGTAVVARRVAPVPAGLAALTLAAALGAPWPTVAAASLALGLAAALVAAVWRGGPVGVLAALVPAGVAGALATRPATLAALGAVTVVAAGCGVAGRTVAIRAGGWLAAVASGAALAACAGLAAGEPAAFWMLVPAAAALLGSMALRARPEARLLEAGAHATAVVALLLTIGSIRNAAAVCALWGIAVGWSALTGSAVPRVGAALGCELLGYWLLLASGQVTVLEAYTLPAAGVALLVGWFAARRRPELGSWVAYGPALLAGFGPDAVTLLAGEGVPVRRLVLGLAALGALIAGAVRRRQAPVVVGGVVLGLVALHETVLLWDRVHRWILLGAAGLLLIGLAMSYERRRRDLARLTSAVGRMH